MGLLEWILEKNLFIPKVDDNSLGTLAKVLGIKLPDGISPKTTYSRILTQREYVGPEDIVISAGWYYHDSVIKESLARGAKAVFCPASLKDRYPDNRVIPLDDTLGAVQKYENWKLRSINAKVIAITGSVGKTTTTALINSIIKSEYNTFWGGSAANSHGAVLRHVQKLQPEHEYWVQEVGGVSPKYIESTAKVIRPDIVVLTNIGESHLDLYKTKEAILEDKSSLEKYAKPDATLVLNMDDEMLYNHSYSHKIITISLSNSAADYYAKDITITPKGLSFTAVTPDREFPIKLNLMGEYNVYNALAAIAVGRLCNVSEKNIKQALKKYYPDGIRQNFTNIGGYNMMIDTFNAEPKTVLGSAETLSAMDSCGSRKIFVTGHIDKIGEESIAKHRQLGRDLAPLDIDLILLFAGDARYTYEEMQKCGNSNMLFFDKRDDLDDWIRKNVTTADIVFYKSGHFAASLYKTIDHVYGTALQNEQQYNNGTTVTVDDFVIRLRKDNIAEIEKYIGSSENVIIPEKYNEYDIIRIRPFAFHKNEVIKSVIIPNSVTYIGKEAFYYCVSLEQVSFPSSLKYIDKNAFNYCKSLKKIHLPEGTIHLARHAFFDCINATDVIVPSTVGFLGTDVFGYTDKIQRQERIICVEKNEYVETVFGDKNVKYTVI